MPWIDRRLVQNFDWTLLAIATGLALVGVVNLISAAPEQMTGGLIPDTAWRQLVWLGLAGVGVLLVLVPDYRTLERFAMPFYVGCVVLLVAVLFLAPVIHGSQRWLVLGPVRLQPSELTKLAMILLFARVLHRRAQRSLGLRDLVVPALLLAVPCALVLRQPDLGTSLLIALGAGTLLLMAGLRVVLLAWIAVAGIAGASVSWLYYLHDYQKERVLTFLNPERDPLGSAYHSIQSQIAIGSGGIFGRGFLRGPQSQLDFLPEQQTDFVFPVLAEEWGFVGAGLVLVLYLALMVRGLMVARASKDAFGAYLAIGVVALFFWAGLINVGMVLGVLPIVGVPLPLLSYGGSSLVVCLLGVGLLLNISMRRYVF